MIAVWEAFQVSIYLETFTAPIKSRHRPPKTNVAEVVFEKQAFNRHRTVMQTRTNIDVLLTAQLFSSWFPTFNSAEVFRGAIELILWHRERNLQLSHFCLFFFFCCRPKAHSSTAACTAERENCTITVNSSKVQSCVSGRVYPRVVQ